MKDVQNSREIRNIPIDNVGITDLRYPIVVLDRQDEKQHTIAIFTLSVSLPHHFKGTHMSRFVEVLNKNRGEITMRTIPKILSELKTSLHAEKSRVEVRFPYFLERSAPETGAKALVDYDCFFIGESNGELCDFVLGVDVPVGSLCPCSKEISDYGAHNQRGKISIEVRTVNSSTENDNFVWIDELIEIAEQSGSSPVYALLKRPDERHVTMHAFNNPVFVEDMVRNVALALKVDQRISWFSVKAENYESIHNHNAFALVEWRRP